MEGERLQENRSHWLLKGLLMGALILAALALGVSLSGPGGSGGDPDSHPGEEPAVAGGADAPRGEPVEGGAGGAPSVRGSRQPGVTAAGELPGGLRPPPGGLAGIPVDGTGLQGSTTAESATGGVILDAVNGDPVGGASVRLTWFHGSADLSVAGL